MQSYPGLHYGSRSVPITILDDDDDDDDMGCSGTGWGLADEWSSYLDSNINPWSSPNAGPSKKRKRRDSASSEDSPWKKGESGSHQRSTGRFNSPNILAAPTMTHPNTTGGSVLRRAVGPSTTSINSVSGESKAQRKKRRKAERDEQQRREEAGAMSGVGLDSVMATNVLPTTETFADLSMPPSPPRFPPSISHQQTPSHIPLYVNMPLSVEHPQSWPWPGSDVALPWTPITSNPQLVSGNSQAGPMPPPSVPLSSTPATSTSLSSSASALQLQMSGKPIGMAPPENPDSVCGTFRSCVIPAPGCRPHMPNPACTLVMENIPRKHRNLRFVRTWCATLGPSYMPGHLDYDWKRGKALLEFKSAEIARIAFNSPRMIGNDGCSGIRLYWYRVMGMVADSGVGEIEEGEVDEVEVEKPRGFQGQSGSFGVQQMSKKQMKKQRKTEHLLAIAAQGQMSAHRVQSIPSQPTAGMSYTSHVDHAVPLPMPASSVLVPTRNANSRPLEDAANSPVQHGDISSATRTMSSTEVIDLTQDDEADEDMTISTTSQHIPLPAVGQRPDSVASSRPSPPLALQIPPEPVNDESEDMDIESPVTARSVSSTFKTYVAEWAVERKTQTPPPQSQVVDPRLYSPIREPTSIAIQTVSPIPRLAQYSGPVTMASVQTPSSFSPQIPSMISFSMPSATPTPTPSPLSDAPSEPRAMKNAPKGPSYTKRVLLARQKELEGRISRSKLELSKSVTSSTPSVTPPVGLPTPSSSSRSETPSTPPVFHTRGDSPSMDELRRLVIESKAKAHTMSDPQHKAPVRLLPGPSPEQIQTVLDQPHKTSAQPPVSGTPILTSPELQFRVTTTVDVEVTTSTSTQATLEQIAESFISETICMAKRTLNPSLEKAALVARQRELEQQIAEGKALVARLGTARTKQDKDDILRLMRERNKKTDQDVRSATSRYHGANLGSSFVTQTLIRTTGTRWPQTSQDCGILIVSDDEGEEDKDKDEEG